MTVSKGLGFGLAVVSPCIYPFPLFQVGDYTHSHVNQAMCVHSGFVGEEIQWSIQENGQQVGDGTHTLKIRNNILVHSSGELEELELYGSAEAYNPVKGDSIGVLVTTIINEPEVYGGYTIPVKGFDKDLDEFDNADVQAAYEAWMAAEDPKEAESTALQAVYLATYYPDLPQL